MKYFFDPIENRIIAIRDDGSADILFRICSKKEVEVVMKKSKSKSGKNKWVSLDGPQDLQN